MAKSKVLLVGAGGVGTMAAYALETGGRAEVTAVLRSNFDVVKAQGFSIDSIEHGQGIKGFKPSHLVRDMPQTTPGGQQFDYIVVTTKNIADVEPSVAALIEPAVTPGHTAILLLQNGLNIEQPLIARFPKNVILSGVSLISASEQAGYVSHVDPDVIFVGPFSSPDVSLDIAEASARHFVEAYNAGGKVTIKFDDNVRFTRWRKLVYNSSYNSVSAILNMDCTRMRISEHIIDDLIRPVMLEIKAIAKSDGIDLPDNIQDIIITADDPNSNFKPSMCQDIDKGQLIEFENIVGEPLREAEKYGTPAPFLTTLYGLLKGLQFKTKEAKGLVDVSWKPSSRYRE